MNDTLSRKSIHLLALASGLAALSWEVLWQVKSTLALGVSAWGTALTLAVTMGGMCIGALVTGHVLRGKTVARPVRIYAVLEWVIGTAGLFLGLAFGLVERIDTWAYTALPDAAALLHIACVAAVIGVPALCMGATLPVLGLAARQFKTSLAVLYGLNTLGAAAGALAAAFILIPLFGITMACWVIAVINIGVGVVAWRLGPGDTVSMQNNAVQSTVPLSMTSAALIVFATGYATFTLEVAWFRSLTAAFRSTTDAFAIMLSCVLISLGLGARLVPLLKKKNVPLGLLVSLAGILVLAVTPIIERFDMVTNVHVYSPTMLLVKWFFMTFYVIVAPVLLLGVALPWILDEQQSPRRWGSLYALNAFAAILGSLSAAWIFLPTIGFASTAWIAGIVVVIAGLIVAPSEKRKTLAVTAVIALSLAVVFESGVGEKRVQGWVTDKDVKPSRVLESYEGPDATVSAAEYEGGFRVIIVDGFITTQQSSGDPSEAPEHYMAMMGHLPMLLHPNPKSTLVICFGTGQTANAVRKSNPETLDVVDINPRVLKLAHNFSANENVLEDPRLNVTIMDGRAYVRRTHKTYDIITLEPMPPNFAGVNALYSKEFYEFSRSRLGPHGVVAQWVPFHLVGTEYSASIAATFRAVFPNAVMWIDPPSNTGILLGSVDDDAALGTEWPGIARAKGLDMSEDEIRKAVVLDRKALGRYADYGKIITDDNQLLAYGRAVSEWHRFEVLADENVELIQRVLEQLKNEEKHKRK